MDKQQPPGKVALQPLLHSVGEVMEAERRGMVKDARGRDISPYELLPHSSWVPSCVAYVLATPEGWIKNVSQFTYNLRLWFEHEGLTLDEVKQIFRAMRNPSRMAEITFGDGHHFRVFASLVAEVCRRRRLAEAKRDRDLRSQLALEEQRQHPEAFRSAVDALMKQLKPTLNEGDNNDGNDPQKNEERETV